MGCHLRGTYLASIFFADDLCLLAPTRSALQKMMDVCSQFCSNHVLAFNPKKSKVVVFSTKAVCYDNYVPLMLGSSAIEYVNSIKYLGATIVSDKGLTFSAAEELRCFYRSANSILNTLVKPNEEVQLQLLYTNCVPVLSYLCAVKTYIAREFQDCNTALNDAIRKIFSYHRWESVRALRESFGYQSLTEIFAKSRNKFFSRLPYHCNPIIAWLASL